MCVCLCVLEVHEKRVGGMESLIPASVVLLYVHAVSNTILKWLQLVRETRYFDT